MYSRVQYSRVQDSKVQYSTGQYSTVQYSTVQYSKVLYSTVSSWIHSNREDTIRGPFDIAVLLKYGSMRY